MTDDDRTITIRIPLVFKKYGGRKTVISPDGGTWACQQPLVDAALLRALARAFRWQRLLDDGEHATLYELAMAEHVSQSYVSRVLRLTLLAPDAVEAILDGRQPEGTRLEDLLDGFPVEWDEQCTLLGTCIRRVRLPSVNRQRLTGSGDARFSEPLPDSACAPRWQCAGAAPSRA